MNQMKLSEASYVCVYTQVNVAFYTSVYWLFIYDIHLFITLKDFNYAGCPRFARINASGTSNTSGSVRVVTHHRGRRLTQTFSRRVKLT